jgi:hypothetical protein
VPQSGKPTFGGGSSPQRPPFSSVPAKEASKPEVRDVYRPAPAPLPSYRVPNGPTVPIDPRDPRVVDVRRRTDRSAWTYRPQRARTVYEPYYDRYPRPVYYPDGYHPYLSYWLLRQPLNILALWVFHHQATIHRDRLNYLYAQQPTLQAEVQGLGASGLKPDPTYAPPNLDPDLMYSDEYVEAAYNPQPASPAGDYGAGPVYAPPRSSGFGLPSGMMVVLVIVAVIAVRSMRAKLGL